MNLLDIFYATAEKSPDHPAIIGPEEHTLYTYASLRATIESTTATLKECGVKPGDCVGLHYASGCDYIILNYALWGCGACVVPIPTELVAEEKQRICSEISLTYVVSQNGSLHVLTPALNGEPIPLYGDAVLVPIKRFRDAPPGFDQINSAFLRFTSGTTGTSKGVVLSHETIFDRIHAANDGLHIGPDDKIIWLLSMSYHFAVSIVAYLSFGATIVLCKNHFGSTIINTLNKHSGTLIYGSPMHFQLMAHDAGSAMLPSLRLAISTTTSLRKETAEEFYKRFKIPLAQAFGIIEIGLPCIDLDKPLEKTGSVGKVLPAYEIQMEDIGFGEDLRAIKFRGKGLFDAYYDPWQTREQFMKDGWFATGDLGKLDSEGYLYILGRNKDIINAAGMKFFPQEVEQLLDRYPCVKESCVYAHKHELFGEVAYANIVMSPATQPPQMEVALKEYCALHLAPYKIPEKFFFVEALTRTASGKLIRDESRLTTIEETSHEP